MALVHARLKERWWKGPQGGTAAAIAIARPMNTTASPLPESRPTSTVPILIVDDERRLSAAYKLLLEDYGYYVQTAASAEEALSSFVPAEPKTPALAIVDMQMPGTDGPTAIAQLRKINPGLKVIASSGYLLSPYFARLADLGVRHFLPKPCRVETLLSEISDVLTSQGGRVEAAELCFS